MKLVLLLSQCDNGRTCPNINATDRGTLVVQGYVVPTDDHSPLSVAPHESVVEIPRSLLAAMPADSSELHHTSRHTVLVRGTTVVDGEALAELNLPDGESAVEISATVFPSLGEEVIAHA